MSIISRMRRQKAVYWAREEVRDEYGVKWEYAAPVEIDCRWEDILREVVTSTGEKLMSSSTVYVDRIMVTGDMLRRGEIDDDETEFPETLTNAFRIQAFHRLPDLKNREELLTAYL